MPALLNDPSPTFTARDQPFRFFYSKGLEPGGSGAAIGKIGEALSHASDALTQQVVENDVRNVEVQAAQMRLHYSKQIDSALTNGAPLQPIQDNLDADVAELSNQAKTPRGYQQAQLSGADIGTSIGQEIFHANAVQQGSIAKQQGAALVDTLAQTVDKNPALQGSANQQVDDFMSTFAGKAPKSVLDDIALDFKQQIAPAKYMSIARTN